jgi:hypothetical protein
MAQLFRPSINTIAKASIIGGVLALVGTGLIGWTAERGPWITNQGIVMPQPVPFSHEHHVRGLGIDCRYCHTSVEDSSFAGLPATKVCMTCHSQIWTNAGLLQPVRDSWATGTPIHWQRVHHLPNFVYFNHSIHVNKGVGCVTCHGEVDGMPIMWQHSSLQMEWCLRCHRDPARILRPRSEVFNLHYDPIDDPKLTHQSQAQIGEELRQRYHLLPHQQMQDCYTCHR